MTSQLKDRVDILEKFYKNKNRDEINKLTGSDIMYNDLISDEDLLFWKSLCKKDFKRI